ncbi:thermonuclease family protein [Roseobacter insulae]|uniref:thermonuclease family protein n=1 Tax=Roseobacter insulae TaxID=2859783 RepID=UPI0021517314|nr:thermonuclease family protein [Roseobacter insulae]
MSEAGETLSGPLRVIDGDTVDVGGTRIRLFGIDAPEADQQCTTAQGTRWRCGAWVTSEVERVFGGRTATCEPLAVDRYGRTVARCHIQGQDIADVLVSAGLAFAYQRYSQDYVLAEKGAAVQALGLRASRVQAPSHFRETRAARREPSETGCDIKGNVASSGALIYHSPGQHFYARTHIHVGKGERWFCSAEAASKAGWRRSKR